MLGFTGLKSNWTRGRVFGRGGVGRLRARVFTRGRVGWLRTGVFVRGGFCLLRGCFVKWGFGRESRGNKGGMTEEPGRGSRG